MIYILYAFIAFVLFMGSYFIFDQATFWSIVFHCIAHPMYVTKFGWTKRFKDYCVDKLLDSYEDQSQKRKFDAIYKKLKEVDKKGLRDEYRDYKADKSIIGDSL